MTNVPNLRFKGFTSNYKKTQFSDCVSIRNGQVDPCVEPYCDMLHIGPGNMEKFTGRLLAVRTAKEDSQTSGKYLFDENDVLYGKINPQFGKVVFPKYKGLCSADTYPLKGSKMMISPYLFYSLQTGRFLKYSISVSMRTGMPKINREELNLYNFNLPSIEEQEKIASFFSLIDKKIELQTEKVEELKNYKKGMLQKMFPRNGETAPELRFAGFTDAWEQRKFKDFITKSGKKNTLNGDYQPYSVSNKLGLVSQTEQFDGSRLDDLGKTSYKLVEPGDFVYNPARVNVGSIAFNNLNKTVIVSSLYVILKMSDQLDNEFVLQYIKSQEFINEVKRNTEGSVREYLFYENFKNVKFPYTSNKDEQIKIGAYFKNLDNLITLHQDKLNALNEYKKGLLQQMFI